MTGTDETALRDAANDAFNAFRDRNHARLAAYVDPACGVTSGRVSSVLDDTEEFLQSYGELIRDFDDIAGDGGDALEDVDFDLFDDLSLSDIYSAARITDVSIDGTVGTVTLVTESAPGLEGLFDEPSDSEWHAINGRWVTPDCTEYLTLEEQEALGYPTSVRFEADGSVTVLDPEASATADTATAPELVLENPATTATTTTTLPPAPSTTTASTPASTPASTEAPAPETTAAPAPPPTAAPAPAPIKLDPAFIVATVSSELPPFRELSYGADNLFDGVLETAWNHCGDCTGNSGVGQRVTIGFTQPVTVVGIRIANGYQKEENNVFFTNNRVASLTVRDIDATFSDSLALADAKGWQLFSLPNVTTTGLLLDIDTIYSGTAYPDLAVSEIEVFVLPTP
ncbi:MAG: hypothetical protein AB8G14_07590 [Ilumatobacter sp.]